MANFHLRDKSLSLKAVGLLSKMLSFNDGWKFSTKGLSAICKEGPDAVSYTHLVPEASAEIPHGFVPPRISASGRFTVTIQNGCDRSGVLGLSLIHILYCAVVKARKRL